MINIVRENGDNIFISIGIHMVHPVAFVEHVRYHFGFWRISNGRGNNIWYISVIPILGKIKFRIRKELSDGRQMYVATVGLVRNINI